MSIRKYSLVQGEYYHIYNRGNSKQILFKDKKDYERFLKLLYGANTSERFNFKNETIWKDIFDYTQEDPPVSIGAYCLMPNHFHILLTANRESGVSEFMQKLSTAYAMYFNKKYRRSGSLFEGKFKAEHPRTDRYLKYLFSYIHLNPVKMIEKEWKTKGMQNKQKIKEYLSTYKFSSYQDYGGKRKEEIILNKRAFPSYFRTSEDFLEEIETWFSYGKENN